MRCRPNTFYFEKFTNFFLFCLIFLSCTLFFFPSCTMNKIKIFSNNKKLRAEIERSLVNPYRSFKKNVSSIFKSSRTCCCGNPHLVCVQCKLTASLRARFWACIMKGQLVRACGGVSAIELRRICMLTGRRHDVRVRGGSAQYVCGRPAQCGRNRR